MIVISGYNIVTRPTFIVNTGLSIGLCNTFFQDEYVLAYILFKTFLTIKTSRPIKTRPLGPED